MISLEKAKALKEAGLAWEPERGDRYYAVGCANGEIKYIGLIDRLPFGYFCDIVAVFAPSLSQLLAEIEKRGYCWKLYKNYTKFLTGFYDIALYQKSAINQRYHTPFAVDTPEDAAADALLWILGQSHD